MNRAIAEKWNKNRSWPSIKHEEKIPHAFVPCFFWIMAQFFFYLWWINDDSSFSSAVLLIKKRFVRAVLNINSALGRIATCELNYRSFFPDCVLLHSSQLQRCCNLCFVYLCLGGCLSSGLHGMLCSFPVIWHICTSTIALYNLQIQPFIWLL